MRDITLIKLFNEFGMRNIEAKTTTKQYIQAMLNGTPMDTNEIKKTLEEKFEIHVTYDTIRGRLSELKKAGIAVSQKGRYRFQTLWTKNHE